MGTWDRQRDWKEIDEEISRGENKTRVLSQLRNLKVAPSKKQGLFEKMKSYIKHLFKL